MTPESPCPKCIEQNGGIKPCEYLDGECPTIVAPTTQQDLQALSSDKPGYPED
jgi:hypothetical protein